MTGSQSDDVRLLLVDDDPQVIRGYVKTLARNGITVETACNGREAVERVKRGSFDVVVSDISMPEMTGIEFLKTIRAHDSTCRSVTSAPNVWIDGRAIDTGYSGTCRNPSPLRSCRACDPRSKVAGWTSSAKPQAGGGDAGHIGRRAALGLVSRRAWGSYGWPSSHRRMAHRQVLATGTAS
jgi:CheY-like chemotaxis protein